MNQVYDLSDATINRLIEFEMCPGFADMHFDHRIARYKQLLPASAHSLCVLMRALTLSDDFCKSIDEWRELTLSDRQHYHHLDHGEICFFWNKSFNFVRFWGKVWCDAYDAYMNMGNDVAYRGVGTSGRVYDNQIGRVTWAISLRTTQFVVLRKFRLLPTHYGPRPNETCEDRIIRLYSMRWMLPDPVKAHCWHLKILDETQHESFRVFLCTDEQNRIESLVQLQPDFAQWTRHELDPVNYFLLEYII